MSGVVQLPRPWLPEGCAEDCWNAYLDLVEQSREPEGDRLDALLAEARAMPGLEPSGLSRSDLRQRIIAGLAIGSLLEGFAERNLYVAVLDESETTEGIIRRRLLFWDPAVGSFEGLILLPPGEGPYSAVIGLHGHRDDAEIFASEYLGVRLARTGMAVLMPRFRAHDCSLIENYVARALLRNGLTLMGLRVYEVLLMHKYLAHLDSVDAGRVGLLGHSGGSSTANLVIRISDAFQAHVADYQVGYRNACGLLRVHCETVPALVPLAADINDFATLAIPHLRVPYGFADPARRNEIVSFFHRHLAEETADAS